MDKQNTDLTVKRLYDKMEDKVDKCMMPVIVSKERTIALH